MEIDQASKQKKHLDLAHKSWQMVAGMSGTQLGASCQTCEMST
jgi:hypothetical protein